MPYTTLAKVSAELNGFTLNATTTPSSSEVSTWIDEADAEINLRSDTIWTTSLASSEYHDYDGSGLLRLYNNPIISVSEFLADSNGIDATSAGWHALTEGRLITNDFILYLDEGEVQFHGTTKPIAGYQNLCVTYIYGRATTPAEISRLSTKMVAKRAIETVSSGSASTEGGSISVGTISVSDPSTFGINHVKQISAEIEDLFKRIGTMKVYKLDRRY